jgi:SEFIR domain
MTGDFHFGDKVTQKGNENIGMIKSQGPVDQQAVWRDLANAMQVLRDQVSPTESPGNQPVAEPVDAVRSPRATSPRVFLCYAHGHRKHMNAVLTLGKLLVKCGIDVHMDRWDLQSRRDWYRWALEEIPSADFVLVIASPLCQAVGDGRVGNKENLGLQAEMTILRELLQSDRDRWTSKILPVVLPGGSINDIPLFLQPTTADHYIVRELTASGADNLLRAITGNPRYARPTAT